MLLLISLLALSMNEAVAQPYGAADTLQARMLSMIFPDSTIIRYEAGQVRENYAGAYRYLTFVDSSGAPEQSYMRTKSFSVESNEDTLSAYRFAVFDDAQMIVDPTIYNTEAEADSAGDARLRYYQGKEDSSVGGYFDPSSAVRFITRLKRASDDAVLQSLDTLRCYLNADGHLRYRTPGRTAAWFHRVVTGDSGVTAYLQVDLEKELPSGTTVSYYGMESTHEPALPDSVSLVPPYQDIPAIAPKHAWRYGLPKGLMNLSLTALYPNPSNGSSLRIGMQSDAEGEALLSFVTADGNVLQQQHLNLNQGYNSLTTSLTGVPSGSYLLVIETNQETLTHSLIIRK